MQKKCEKIRTRDSQKSDYINEVQKPKFKSAGLNHDANAATDAGLTYGQYMGRIGSENLWENRRMHIYRR